MLYLEIKIYRRSVYNVHQGQAIRDIIMYQLSASQSGEPGWLGIHLVLHVFAGRETQFGVVGGVLPDRTNF